MPKIRLKRTPAEETERALRKARKAARKEAKRRFQSGHDLGSDDEPHSKRHKSDGWYERAGNDSDGGFDRTDLGEDDNLQWREEQRLRREEDERFQQRMWDEVGEQDRLDSLETDLNSYSHIPSRWRPSHADPAIKANLQSMEEEEYAEWVRQGMWRKKHGDLYEEQQRQKAAEQAKKVRERELAAETARLEAAALQERRKKKREMDRNRWHYAKEQYETRWKALLAGEGEEDSLLFRDIAWPCLQAYGKSSPTFSLEDITAESVSSFLFDSIEANDTEKTKRDKVRETLLRFHPDKFEGRVMSRVKFVDKERVQEAVGVVVRILNELSKNK